MKARHHSLFSGATLALVGLLGPLGGCSEIIWRGNLAGAQAQASRDGRLVVVYFGALLNDDCLKMEDDVFSSFDVIDTMAGTIPVRLEAAWHVKWAQQLGIRHIPSFVIYSSDKRVISIRQGAMNEPQFRAFIVAGKLNQ